MGSVFVVAQWFTAMYLKPSFGQLWTGRQAESHCEHKGRLSKKEMVRRRVVISSLREHSRRVPFVSRWVKHLLLFPRRTCWHTRAAQAYWANIILCNYERLRVTAAVTFPDSNGVFPSWLMMWGQLTRADTLCNRIGRGPCFHLCW